MGLKQSVSHFNIIQNIAVSVIKTDFYKKISLGYHFKKYGRNA